MIKDPKIYIIGKNSRLFKDFYNYLSENFSEKSNNFVLCSYKDIDNISISNVQKSRCVLFSISMLDIENSSLLEELINKFNEVRIIGSSSAKSYCAESFNYSRVKYNQFMDAKTRYEKGSKVYYYLFGDFYGSKRIGKKYISNFDDLEKYIFSSRLGEFSELCAKEKGKNLQLHTITYNIFEKIFGIKITAAIFKFLSPFTYGYTRIR